MPLIGTARGSAAIDLKRTANGWTLNDTYKAKPADVNMLLRTFKRVEVKSPVPKSAEATALRVMGASAKKVEIYEGGDVPSKIWIVGHGTQDHFGTYMLLEKPGEGRSNTPFICGMGGFTGILGTRFHTKLDEWRSTELYRFRDFRDLAEVKLETPLAPANSYTVRQNAVWQIGGSSGTNSSKTHHFARIFPETTPLTAVSVTRPAIPSVTEHVLRAG